MALWVLSYGVSEVVQWGAMIIVMQARGRRYLAGVGSEKRLGSGDIGRQAGVGCGKRD